MVVPGSVGLSTAITTMMTKSIVGLVLAFGMLAPNAVLAQTKYAQIHNQTTYRAYVVASGYGDAWVSPGATVTGSLRSDLRRSIYVTARVGNYKTGRFVPYRGNVAACRVARTPWGTIQIVY